MTKHLLVALVALSTLFITAPAAAQAYDCWPVRCASTQASTKPGLKKVEDKKEGDKEEEAEEAAKQEAEAAAKE